MFHSITTNVLLVLPYARFLRPTTVEPGDPQGGTLSQSYRFPKMRAAATRYPPEYVLLDTKNPLSYPSDAQYQTPCFITIDQDQASSELAIEIQYLEAQPQISENPRSGPQLPLFEASIHPSRPQESKSISKSLDQAPTGSTTQSYGLYPFTRPPSHKLLEQMAPHEADWSSSLDGGFVRFGLRASKRVLGSDTTDVIARY